jgi:hypothetical protein
MPCYKELTPKPYFLLASLNNFANGLNTRKAKATPKNMRRIFSSQKHCSGYISHKKASKYLNALERMKVKNKSQSILNENNSLTPVLCIQP